MKFEWKVVIFAVVCSLAFMFIFTYGCSLGQKTLYAYQVGIYKEASNTKNDQYYVLSMISEKKEDIEKHATQVKGIMKTYIVPTSTTNEMLLDSLSKGDDL